MNDFVTICIVFLIGIILIDSLKTSHQVGGKQLKSYTVCHSPDTCDVENSYNNCGSIDYVKYDNDCPGNDMLTRDRNGNLIPIEYNKNSPGVNCCNLLSKCEELCDKYSNCVGFSYDGNRCPLKMAGCDSEVKNGYHFYKKPGSPFSMKHIVPPHPIIKNFRIIVKKINSQNYKPFIRALEPNKQFTMSVMLDVVNYNDNFEYQRLFNGGNNSTWYRTPGVWINQGYLHIRASSDKNMNDGNGCWKVNYKLQKKSKYHLILVYSKRAITVYLNGRLIVNCPTVGNILFYSDLHVGKSAHERGADINMSIAYLPIALDTNTIVNNWRDIEHIHI